MTMGCARCHDHKYDPIKQKEFYQLYAFFNRVPEKGLDGRAGNAEPILTLPTPEQEAQVKELESAIKARETGARRKDRRPRTRRVGEDARRHASCRSRAKDWSRITRSTAASPIISGNYRHGRVLTGDVTYGEGRVGEGATSNGEAHIDLGNTAAFDRNQPFTFAPGFGIGGVKPYDRLR